MDRGSGSDILTSREGREGEEGRGGKGRRGEETSQKRALHLGIGGSGGAPLDFLSEPLPSVLDNLLGYVF